MLKRLIAPVLGLVLVTAVPATPARADNGQIVGALAGIATLAIIGSAIANAQKDRHHGPKVVTVTPPPPAPPVIHRPVIHRPVIHPPVMKQPRPKPPKFRPVPPRFRPQPPHHNPHGWHNGWTNNGWKHHGPDRGHDGNRWNNNRDRGHDGRKHASH